MWNDQAPAAEIQKILSKCAEHKNKYLFQSKNPGRFLEFVDDMLLEDVVFATTLESDRDFFEGPPPIDQRYNDIIKLKRQGYNVMVTVEPIMQFDLNRFKEMIDDIGPDMIAIGADSQSRGLPEPSADEVKALLRELGRNHKLFLKPNLGRLMQ